MPELESEIRQRIKEKGWTTEEIMIVHKKLGSIANWFFEDRRRFVSRKNPSEVYCLLEMLQSVAEILEAHQLLQVSTIVLSGWLDYDSKTDSLFRKDRSDMTISIPKESRDRSLLDYCKQALDRLPYFLYPIDVEFLGSGIVFDADGIECELPNVTWVSGRTENVHFIEVYTQSDAWLPYTLLGESQMEVWINNAKRLRAALQEIQNSLGIQAYTDGYTRYAVCDEDFTLTNLTSGDDEIVPINEVFSNFEEWKQTNQQLLKDNQF